MIWTIPCSTQWPNIGKGSSPVTGSSRTNGPSSSTTFRRSGFTCTHTKTSRNDLSPKSQASLTKQYELAGKLGQMVVFVRDNDSERLVSYLFDYK